MPNANKVILMGYLTRDPECRYTPKGTAVCNLSIAINRTWTTEAGEKKEEVTFVDCTAWGRTGETIGQYLAKGKPIFIEGRLALEQWDDKETGAKRSKLKVVVESFQFLGQSQTGGEHDQTERQPARQAARKPVQQPDSGEDQRPVDDDENIPF